jgi:hypothetical protein
MIKHADGFAWCSVLQYGINEVDRSALSNSMRYNMIVNSYNHPRGTICIARMYIGWERAFKIDGQHQYKEFTGCFSII